VSPADVNADLKVDATPHRADLKVGATPHWPT
jgi:hypothetical protein